MEADDIKKTALIPSAVDGFHTPIFYPVSQDLTSGRAIDLNKISDPRSRGAVEIVIESVTIGQVHIRLITIPEDQKRNGMWLEELESSLLNYYEAEIPVK